MALTVEYCRELITKVLNEHKMIRDVLHEANVNVADFFTTVSSDEKLAEQYTQAQKFRAELYVEQIIDIADNDENFGRARNRIDARRWYASKMQPSRYGDRIDVNVTQTVDITSALTEAKKRAQLTDSSDILEGELVVPKALDIFD